MEISKNAMTDFFHNLSMPALSIANNNVILMFHAISALVRNIACLLQNRVDESIDTEKLKSEDLARLINNYELVKLPDDFKSPTILPVKEIKK